MERAVPVTRFLQLTRFARCSRTTGADAVQGHETQIVQSCNQLDRFVR